MTALELSPKRGFLQRSLPYLAGSAIAAMGMYEVAHLTGEKLPIRASTTARQLPWKDNKRIAFAVDNSNLNSVQCGHKQTFLGNFYDDSQQSEPWVESIDAYLLQMEHFAGEVLPADTKRQLSLSHNAGKVILCASATVERVKPHMMQPQEAPTSTLRIPANP
jgi:hypothetical protein